MLNTGLKHFEERKQIDELLKNNENVIICCGRMGPMCIPVYDIVQNLESEYPHIQMRDRDFDIPSASYIRNLPECALFTGLPFTIYFKNGRVVKATSGIRDENQIRIISDDIFKG